MYFTMELWPWCKSFDKGRNIYLKTGAVKSVLARVPPLMLIDVRLLRKAWLYMLTLSGAVWGIGVKKDIQDTSLMLRKYVLFCKLRLTSNYCFVRSLRSQEEGAARPKFQMFFHTISVPTCLRQRGFHNLRSRALQLRFQLTRCVQ